MIPLKYATVRGDHRQHFIPQTKRNMSTTIDLEKELIGANRSATMAEDALLAAQAKLDIEAAKITAKVAEAYRAGLADELGFDYATAEVRRLRNEREQYSQLPTNRIMTTSAIQNVCVKFGLRFLPTRFYRGALDEGIGPAVQRFREQCGGKLPILGEREFLQGASYGSPLAKPQFSIAAPASAFQLEPRPRDPLLFCRLSSLKWYLVHKWGDDLKTADIRKGETNTSNWNSPFQDVSSNISVDIPSFMFSNEQLSAMQMQMSNQAVYHTTGSAAWLLR